MDRNVFDFLARGISIIYDKVDSAFFENYNAMTRKENTKLNHTIQEAVPCLFHHNEVIDISRELLENRSLLEQLDIFLDKCMQEENYMVLIRLFSKLDHALADRIQFFRLKRIAEKDNINEMNCNVMTTKIQLLPRCQCVWEHKSRDSISSYSINNYLTHCYYIPCEQIKPFKVMNIFYEDVFKRNNRKYVSIGVSPLFARATINLEYIQENSVNYFNVTGTTCTDEIIDSCLEQLKLEALRGVDISVFPEMLGSEALIDALKTKLSLFPKDDEPPFPSLILCPTWWHDNKNVCYVLNDRGEEILRQEKQFPFPFNEGDEQYKENILPDKTIHLIHCEGIGRIAIMICKDALNRDYLLKVLKELKATLIIVPAFSTGYHDFEEIMQLCRPYDCAAIWVNSCSVQMINDISDDKLDTIAFTIQIGKKHGMPNGTQPIRRDPEKCKNTDACKTCHFIEKLYYD